MQLTDLNEPYDAGEEFRFWMTDMDRRVPVRIARETLTAVEARSGASGFETHRAAFAALATKKYARGDREPDGSITLRLRDV